jgi:hypothetical protein
VANQWQWTEEQLRNVRRVRVSYPGTTPYVGDVIAIERAWLDDLQDDMLLVMRRNFWGNDTFGDVRDRGHYIGQRYFAKPLRIVPRNAYCFSTELVAVRYCEVVPDDLPSTN